MGASVMIAPCCNFWVGLDGYQHQPGCSYSESPSTLRKNGSRGSHNLRPIDQLALDSAVFTVKEVAAYLRVHQTTIYRLLRQGKIPAFKVGGDWRFKLDAINRWMLAARES